MVEALTMDSATRRELEDAIARLDAQRRRYELAVDGAPSDRARDRHRRNVARLDEEIAAYTEALGALGSTAAASPASPSAITLETSGAAALLSGPWARFDLDGELPLDRRLVTRLVVLAFAVGFVCVAFGFLLAGA
jgi:hypothetical protein